MKKCPKRDIPEHLFIANPYTGKLVNVLPLFELMSENVISEDGAEDVRYQLQQVHDFVSTNPPGGRDSVVDPEDWAAISFTVIHIRQTFERMKEVTP